MISTLPNSGRNRTNPHAHDEEDDGVGVSALRMMDGTSHERSNQYRAFLDNPVVKVDPLGLDAATTQPSPPGDGEQWFDPGHHGAGIRGPGTPGINCIGQACGVKGITGWNTDDANYVPKGCKEVPCDASGVGKSPCDKCDLEMTVLVATLTAKKTGILQARVFHVIYRDPSNLPSGWGGKLGMGGVGAQSPVDEGWLVRDITDPDAHFNQWLGLQEYPGIYNMKLTKRCFCCHKSEMQPDPKIPSQLLGGGSALPSK